MGKRRNRASIIKQTLQRLDSKMAIGSSRYEMKQSVRHAAQEQGLTGPWAISDGKIHSWTTRHTYQQHSLKFVTWARDTQGIRSLETLDAQRHLLASEYLQQHVSQKRSPYTIQAERAALRLFFGDSTVADDVQLPKRTRAGITRSRGTAVRDRHFSATKNQEIVHFQQGTGLRRSELRDLRTTDIIQTDGKVYVVIKNGKGGKARHVPVRQGFEQDVLARLGAVKDGARLFARIPEMMDVHAYRREYAQALYQELSGRDLPPAQGRLKRGSYDKEAVIAVSRALGHNRMDVILKHYLR